MGRRGIRLFMQWRNKKKKRFYQKIVCHTWPQLCEVTFIQELRGAGYESLEEQDGKYDRKTVVALHHTYFKYFT